MAVLTSRRAALGFGAFAVGLIITLLATRESLDDLAPAILQAARQQWRDAQLSDYRIRYLMNGSEYDVSVRGGIVDAVTVDGRSPLTENYASYSVEGMFDVLEMEIDALSDPAGPFAARRASILSRVRFNDEYGYVERYVRSAAGFGKGASIETLEFSAGV